MSMLDQLEQEYQTAVKRLDSAETVAELSEWFYATLGRKGSIQLQTRNFGNLADDEKPLFGKRINEIKTELKSAYDAKEQQLKSAEMAHSIATDAIDVTLPGTKPPKGGLHPSTIVMRQIYRIFGDMGFQIYRSGDVVTDEYNFELLNMPPEHPARDMQDTFYTNVPDVILRTHTSPGQIHAMRAYNPEPLRMILPGMCYRNEQITARSEIQFHQIEGIAVGHDISMADLKGTLTEFAKRLFGFDRKTRFRASYFPFTEPSAEMDVTCILCDGKGCKLCKMSGWLEILGCGMVHPTVLRNGGYDPDVYTGFAFGMGPERITMLKYGIEDIRYFWKNDLRFLNQFA